MRHHLRERFDAVVAARSFEPGDVAAGRRFVKAYVEYVHYVERLFEAATTAAHGHAADASPPALVDHDGHR
jgi:hypothetical protein